MLSSPGSSLRSRLLLLVILAAIPLFVLTLYAGSKERRIEISHHQAYAVNLARFVAADQEQLIEGARRFLFVLSQTPAVKNGSPEECTELFKQLLRMFPEYKNLTLVDALGNLSISAVPFVKNENFADRLWFQRAMQARDFVSGGYMTFPVSQETVAVLAFPVLDERGQVVSVLCASLSLNWWFDRITPIVQPPSHAMLTVLNLEETILENCPEPEKWVGLCIPKSPLIKHILLQKEGSVDGADVGERSCIFGFTQLPHAPENTFVMVSIRRDVALAEVENHLVENLTLLGLGTGAMLIIALLGAELLLLRRVKPLMTTLGRLADGDLSARTGIHYGRSEFSRLARTVDDMAYRLERRQIESEQLEEVLMDSGRRFRAIFNNAFQFTGIIEPDGTLLEVNQTALDFAGIKIADVSGRPFWETPWWQVSAEVQQTLKEDIAEAARGNLVRHETENRGAGGKIATIDFSIKPLKDDSGRVTLLIAEARDITERKRAERALMESEARYRAIVEDQTELISRFLPDERLTFVNEAYCRYYDETREELIGRTFWHHIDPDESEEIRRYIRTLTRENSVATIEHRVIAAGGQTRWLQWTDRAIFNEQGELIEFQAVGRDITDKKQVEESLLESQKELRLLSSRILKAQEDERKRIARELHDSIGQSLSAIKFSVENALCKAGQDMPAPCRKSLEAIIPTVQNSIDEVRQIMTDLRPSMLDDLGILATIGWFCREFQSVYSMIHIEKEIDVQEDDVPGHLKIVVFRIVQEALNNIAKHSKASFVSLALKKTGNIIELNIEDDGIGFDSKSMIHCECHTGGFGLSSMKERAGLSEGCFSITSEKGEGTIIRATWSCAPGEDREPQS